MPEGFGERLRKQREERQIDLGWIADQTKIKRSLLEALERDDVSHWPSGIFRRAYIRTYAQFIGLDPEVVLREFLDVHPEPVDLLEAAAAAALEEAARRNAAPPMRLRTIVDSAIGSLARLRRSGATDQPVPASRPLDGPARTRGDRAAMAPHGSLANGAAPAVRTRIPQPSPDPGTADPHETVSALDADDTVIAPPGAARDGSEPPDASSQNRDVATAAAWDEPRAVIDPRLEAVAALCTEFGRVGGGHDEILVLLEGAARALDATGLIVWLWDESSEALWPALVQGYSDQVLARLPKVRLDADNATAEAFRSASPCEVAASAQATGALVVPLLIPEGCAGVLAIELQPGIQTAGALPALATLLAAALAQLTHRLRLVARSQAAEHLNTNGGGERTETREQAGDGP